MLLELFDPMGFKVLNQNVAFLFVVAMLLLCVSTVAFCA